MVSELIPAASALHARPRPSMRRSWSVWLLLAPVLILAGCGAATSQERPRISADEEPGLAHSTPPGEARVEIAPIPDGPNAEPGRERPGGHAILRQVYGYLTGTISLEGLRPHRRYALHLHRGEPSASCDMRSQPELVMTTFVADDRGAANVPIHEVARFNGDGVADRRLSEPRSTAIDRTDLLDDEHALELHGPSIADPTVEGGWGSKIACGNIPVTAG